MNATKLDKFTQAYIECALWSSTDDKGTPLDSNYDESDLSPQALEQMAKDCADLGEQLTDMAHPYGSCDLYVGDDGQIYVS